MEKTSEHLRLEKIGYSFLLLDPGMPNEAFVHVSFAGSVIGISHGLDRAFVLRDSLRIANEHQSAALKPEPIIAEPDEIDRIPSQPVPPPDRSSKLLIVAALLVLVFLGFYILQ